MAFQLSPGVLVTERDDTLSVPSVSTTAGGFVGYFQWGPVDEIVQIDSERNLVATFGKPTSNTYTSFFTAANFLSYGNNLKVIRTVSPATARNAAANTTILVKNDDHYDTLTFTNVGEWVARYPGNLGSSLKVSLADANTFGTWAYKTQFSSVSPNTSSYTNAIGGRYDELHVIVLDSDGTWSGSRDTVLEKFEFLSKASDAKTLDGGSNYYKDVINNNSKYIRFANHTANTSSTTNWGETARERQFANLLANVTVTLRGGIDPATGADLLSAYDTFANDELYDINLIPVGSVNVSVASYVITNVAEVRKDCMVFISPLQTDVINNTLAVTNVVNTRNSLPSSSYAVYDSGWKYQYDRYNDVYRYIPLNGDIAGLTARNDFIADPWFSPAGFNRGGIKNVIKLAYSPNKSDRDTLYRAGVNPVVSFPGQGTVLFGDKTLLAKPSAFDRINVRRLFITLEKAIATAAKFQLFEFNDAFTRAQFRNLVEPFLRDVQGRRGITDFRVICDDTNNTGEIIDRNEFVADIYIKPARAINFIQLNFIATRSGISFEEVGA